MMHTFDYVIHRADGARIGVLCVCANCFEVRFLYGPDRDTDYEILNIGCEGGCMDGAVYVQNGAQMKPVRNAWEDAMLDEAVNTWCLTQANKGDPQKLLRDIISTTIEWDRDPRISDRPRTHKRINGLAAILIVTSFPLVCLWLYEVLSGRGLECLLDYCS